MASLVEWLEILHLTPVCWYDVDVNHVHNEDCEEMDSSDPNTHRQRKVQIVDSSEGASKRQSPKQDESSPAVRAGGHSNRPLQEVDNPSKCHGQLVASGDGGSKTVAVPAVKHANQKCEDWRCQRHS